MCVFRLEQFESQEALAQLISTAGDGLARMRRELLSLSDPSPADVQAVLHRGSGFVEGFKKHTRTAQTLIAAAKPKGKAHPKAKGANK